MNILRFALRQLAKSPGYTAIAMATLALGIGLNTTMFSLLNELILRPLPYPEKDRIVKVYRTTEQDPKAAHSATSYLDLKREAAGYIRLAGFRSWGYSLTQPGRTPENLNGMRVAPDFFTVLGMQPALGRVFLPEEDQPGNHVMVLSHEAWVARFGGDPSVIGRNVTIDGESTTIIGVMPEEFSSVLLWGPGEAFRPLGFSELEKANRTETSIEVIGRFEGTLTLEQLNTRLGSLAAELAPNRPREQSGDGLRAAILQSTTVPPETGVALTLLLGVASFVLLIVCGNLANLQLARAVSRGREFAIRAALGASRRHLLQPLLVESVLLALGGGLLGILVAVWGNEWISSQLSASLPINFRLEIDWRVIGFAMAVSLITGVVFGLAPAWLSSRVNVNETLKSGGRASTGSRSQHYLRDSLIVLQFAAALVLLSSTGFFIRGMTALLDRNPGWQTAGLTQCVLNLPTTRYATPEQTMGFYTQLDERLRALPGVDNVAIGWTAPIFVFLTQRTFVVEGLPPPEPGHEPVADVNAVTPEFVDTLRMRLLAGRGFSATDKLGAPPVVMINESLSKALFAGEDPIGRHIVTGEGDTRVSAEVVGVFGDIAFAGNPAPPKTPFLVFKPLAQETWNYVTVLVRSESGAMTGPLRRVVNELDPTIPVQMLNTVEELAKVGTRGMTLITTIFISFSLLGLFLAALGLYGVIIRLVMQRTPEIGVRMALGAQLRDILGLIVGSGFRLALIGAGVGLLGAILMNLIFGALFANGALGLDYTTLGLTTLILVLVALVATYLPARRATKVNPMVALRAE